MYAEVAEASPNAGYRALSAFRDQQCLTYRELMASTIHGHNPGAFDGDHHDVDFVVDMGRDLLVRKPGEQRQVEIGALMAPLWPLSRCRRSQLA